MAGRPKISLAAPLVVFALTMLSTAAGRADSTEFPTIDRSSVTATAVGFFPRRPGASPVRISQSTTAGQYAIVAFDNGEIEGKVRQGELLLERFPFGWQAVDMTTDRQFGTGDLLARGIAADDAAVLLHGATPLSPNEKLLASTSCAADVGDSAEVAAVRRLMLFRSNEAIGVVTVVSDYALAGWGGNGGGMDAFAKRSGVWSRLGAASGGGQMNAKVLVKLGVPEADAQHLMRDRGGC